MPYGDVPAEKTKWLCERWSKAAGRQEAAFNEFRRYVDEIARTAPLSTIEGVDADDLNALAEHTLDLAEEAHDIVLGLRGVVAAAVKFARKMSADRETTMAAVRAEFPGLTEVQFEEVERRLYPAAVVA